MTDVDALARIVRDLDAITRDEARSDRERREAFHRCRGVLDAITHLDRDALRPVLHRSDTSEGFRPMRSHAANMLRFVEEVERRQAQRNDAPHDEAAARKVVSWTAGVEDALAHLDEDTVREFRDLLGNAEEEDVDDAPESARFNHAFSLAFEYDSPREEPTIRDVRGMRHALLARVASMTDQEFLEACGAPFDTMRLDQEA